MTTLGKTWTRGGMDLVRQCLECGNSFNPFVHNQVRCSPKCQYEQKKKTVRDRERRIYIKRVLKRNCVSCGISFEYVGTANPLTCSKECSKKHKSFLPYRSTVDHKLKHCLRNAIHNRIGSKVKGRSWYIGYSSSDLKSWLEGQFKPGMSWKNYGRKGWHIDHKRPLASFNFFDDCGNINHDEVVKAMALENLQPLWAKENLIKGDKTLWA